MINSTTWLYGAEVLPIALRSRVMGLGSLAHFIVNVGSKYIYHLRFRIRSDLLLQSPKQVLQLLPTLNKITFTYLLDAHRSLPSWRTSFSRKYIPVFN
jgi:hypothetical protein